MVLAGVTVRTDQVQLLARLLEGDELASKLARGITNANQLVALSGADRQRIVDVLGDPPPSGLAELQSALVKQLKQHKEREAKAEQALQAQRAREARQSRDP